MQQRKIAQNLKKRYLKLHKLQTQYEKSFQKFLKNGIGRSIMASIIYGVNQNNRRGIGYDPSEDKTSTNDQPKSPFSYHYTHTRAKI